MGDPIPGTLGGRPIFWCPGGEGNAPYCPRPTDPDEYIYCCTYGYDITIPTCCRYPTFAGLLYAYVFVSIVSISLFVFFTCWFCPWCPMAKRTQRISMLKQRQ